MTDLQTTDGGPTAANLDDPGTRLEVVRSVWREVLDVADVSDDATFFDLGGDSLRLVILVERLNQATGRKLKTVDLFRAGTVRGHADLLAESDRPASTGFRGTGRDHLLAAARARAGSPRQEQ
ncbi:acyl carrier protein [Lentzea alba]|uniref:acyl carrier protein n=1 Tax=Lentzea alba TaxID=2714351 RepID=UPI0039BF672C